MESQPPVNEARPTQARAAGLKSSLGTIRLRNIHTKDIVFIPTPCNDPNDPLTWCRTLDKERPQQKLILCRSTPMRAYLTFLAVLVIFMGNFFSVGPSVAIMDMIQTFFGPPGPHLLDQLSKTAFFITSAALMQGMGNLFWMPLILKYGRRPVYVFAFLVYTATTVWLAAAKTYGSELGARIIFGFASGVGECLAPLTIADLYFVHQRGAIMA